MNALILVATSVFTLLFGAWSAAATIVDVTYSGALTSGFDTFGAFGPPNTDLTGDDYKIVFRFDTTKGVTPSSSNWNYAIGGPEVTDSPPSPSLRTTVTINGVSFTLSTENLLGHIYAYNGPPDPFGGGANQQLHQAVYGDGSGSNFGVLGRLGNGGASGQIPGTIDLPFIYTPLPGDSGFATINFFSPDIEVDAVGSVARLQYSLVSKAVPEPSTWAMMLIGFAGLGLAGLVGQNRDRCVWRAGIPSEDQAMNTVPI